MDRVNRKSFEKDSLQRPLSFTGCGCVGQWWSCVPISIKTEACASQRIKTSTRGGKEMAQWFTACGITVRTDTHLFYWPQDRPVQLCWPFGGTLVPLLLENGASFSPDP